jgi:L-alanine-DL-glutamate epimerase and related enzymes of enolase superfamily
MTLETDAGIKGYAAGVAFLREGAGLKDLLLPFLFGRDPMNVEEVVQIARSATFLGLRLWWIEMAFWDIIGKALGQPVYRLLGGYQERVKAYASTGELREIEFLQPGGSTSSRAAATAVELQFAL